jgi:6-phosphofructokinase 2
MIKAVVNLKRKLKRESSMKSIVTLTMNPSIDESSSVTNVIADKKLRCSAPTFEPGGGGINVSRVIKSLGGESLAIYPAGGPAGQMFKEMLEKLKISNHAIGIQGMTRTDLMVVEESSGK